MAYRIKKINSKEGNMMELRATPRAEEKLKEIVNGSKEEVNHLFEKITKEGIKKEDYPIFLKNPAGEFYYHKCKNIYVIFIIEEKSVTLLDFLTETEFNEKKKSIGS